MTGPMSFRYDRANERRLHGRKHHRDKAAARRADDTGVAQSEHDHEVDDVLHLDRNGVVFPVRIVLGEPAPARVEREHIAGRRRLAQRQCDAVKIAAVARQSGETYDWPRFRSAASPIVTAIKPKPIAHGEVDVVETLPCRFRHALVLPLSRPASQPSLSSLAPAPALLLPGALAWARARTRSC